MMKSYTRVAWNFLLAFALAAANAVFSATCNKDGFNCVTNNVFQECVDSNVTSPDPYVCPPGTFCYRDCSFPCSAQSCAMCNPAGYYCPSENFFQLCDTSGSPGPDLNPCPLGTVCSQNCNNPSICTEQACPVSCSETSRLPVNGNNTNYYLCIVSEDGSVIVKEFSCPSKSVYDSINKRCMNSSTTTPFKCLTSGRFPDPTDCHQYYLCSRSYLTGYYYYYYLYQCPNKSYFSSKLSKCVWDPTVCTVTMSSSSKSVCKSYYGRFADPDSCSHYFMCSWSNGELSPYRYECPGNSTFDLATSKCKHTSKECVIYT